MQEKGTIEDSVVMQGSLKVRGAGFLKIFSGCFLNLWSLVKVPTFCGQKFIK